MKRYYVVKKGREPGIYRSWGECEQQIHGFSGAVHKSFNTQEEAKRYYQGESTIEWAGYSEKDTIDIYVDGSYDESLHLGGYGCVIVQDSNILKELSGVIKLTENDTSRNIHGEVRAALEAVE